ncbi:MAG TPA: hypothetical protein VJK90_16610, partial [Acetobacteraceae bacterium]|nr:hypothetical protein [Acetobacteraceae bacterium]
MLAVYHGCADPVDVACRFRQPAGVAYWQKHLLAIEGLTPPEIGHLLDVAENYVLLNRSGKT